jgi:hypothetical protein
MLGTLTLHGPLDTIAEIAVELEKKYPNGITATAAPTTWQGWDVPGAKALLAELAPKARTAVETVVAGNGFAADDELRKQIGDSLRGSITGPITKQMQKLQKKGVLPDGLPKVIEAQYDPTITSRQRTGGLVMDGQLVPIFRAALS